MTLYTMRYKVALLKHTQGFVIRHSTQLGYKVALLTYKVLLYKVALLTYKVLLYKVI